MAPIAVFQDLRAVNQKLKYKQITLKFINISIYKLRNSQF